MEDPNLSSLPRRFFRLTGLNILANVTVPLAGLVDTAMLWHLADIRFLAGAALAVLLFEYLYWSCGFLRMATTGTTAQARGRGDAPEVYRVLYRSLALGVAIGLAFLVLAWPIRELGFALLAGSGGVEAAGRDYFAARIWDAPATLANFALLGWFLGREESGRALALTLTATLSNVVFNYGFIVYLGLAAFGSGLGTACSQYLMLAVGIGFFLRSPGRVPFRWREVVDRERLRPLLHLNRDILVRTLCLETAYALFSNWSALAGTVVLAGNTLLLRLVLMASYLVDGVAFAAESLAGTFFGQGDRAGLRRLTRLTLATGAGFAAAFLALFALAPRAILGLLTSHGEVVASALRYAPWLAPVILAGAFAFLFDGLLLGLTQGRVLRNALLVSTLAVFLPLALAGRFTGSVHVLWLALAAFMAARALTLGQASRWLLAEAGETRGGSPP